MSAVGHPSEFEKETVCCLNKKLLGEIIEREKLRKARNCSLQVIFKQEKTVFDLKREEESQRINEEDKEDEKCEGIDDGLLIVFLFNKEEGKEDEQDKQEKSGPVGEETYNCWNNQKGRVSGAAFFA